MEGKSGAYDRIKRRAAKRLVKAQRSQQWKTIVASGLIGLFGALIGGGVTYATTSRQVASQEQLNLISRRDNIYSAYYASLVTFQDSVLKYNSDVDSRKSPSSNAPKILSATLSADAQATLQLLTTVEARLAPLQLVASLTVRGASLKATLSATSVVISFQTMMTKQGLDTKELRRKGDALEVSMNHLMDAMRGDLNVNDLSGS